MKLPLPEYLKVTTLGELYGEAQSLNLKLPRANDLTVLREPAFVGGLKVPNRFCVQPMEGCDAGLGGMPAALTFRRYRRYAEGGFGLIWLEATAVDGPSRSNPRQLWINRRNVKAFAELVQDIKQAGRQRWGHEAVVILQLSHAGRYSQPEGVAGPLIAHHELALDRQQGIPADYPVVSDEYLDRLQETYLTAGGLAVEAGFDGVDVKACHGDLTAELLAAATRPGNYGGSLENRSRFLCETTAKLRAALHGTLLASRITVCTGVKYPFGFGQAGLDPRQVDTSEPVQLVRALQKAGVQLLNISAGNPSENKSDKPERSLEALAKHPEKMVVTEHDPPEDDNMEGRPPCRPQGFARASLVRFMRQFEITKVIQRAVPAILVVSGGFSWFRHFLPTVAAGVIGEGGGAIIGLGRAALAYPDLPGDLIRSGHLEPDKCCLTCSACVQLIKDGGQAGCAIMDSEIYGAEYRQRRHFALDNLKEEARRCLGCEPAPCRTSCPAQIDIPGFIKAFVEDDIAKAYALLRKDNVLPGMCAHLCPVGSMCEGRCVTNTLQGKPIPIHDIQFAVAWSARQSGLTGARVPERDSGKHVAVVGGGPAGIACAVTLLEQGHHVVLLERTSRLGGTPELAIRASRFTGAHAEVEAILRPALCEARLWIKFGCELGRGISLDELRRDHDAVFLAAGAWGERSLGRRPDGVLGGVDFLRKARSKEIVTVPSRVILLAGGDSAMDSASVARELGARELIIVYEGPLSEMHWHMPDSWFRTEGVRFMTSTRPVGYQVEAGGKVSGLKVRLNQTSTAGGVADPEIVLEADLIIEAMGLGLEASLVTALKACQFGKDGLIKVQTGAAYSCGLPGVFAGGGLINGGASVVQCVAEGMQAGCEIAAFLDEGGLLRAV